MGLTNDDLGFAEALREAIAARGLGLERISARLAESGHHVSIASLSYWQTGRRLPLRTSSLSALGALERLLGVPRGDLASKLPAPARVSHSTALPAERTALPEHIDFAAHVEAIREDSGLEWDWGFQRVSIHYALDLDERHRVHRQTIRQVIKITVPWIDRLLVAHRYPSPGVILDVLPTRDISRGRTVVDADLSLCIAELTFPRTFEGESRLIEYDVAHVGPVDPISHSQISVSSRLEHLVLEIHFPTEASPTHATVVMDAEGQTLTDSTAVTGDTISLLRSDFGPGTLKIEWPPLDPPLAGDVDRGTVDD